MRRILGDGAGVHGRRVRARGGAAGPRIATLPGAARSETRQVTSLRATTSTLRGRPLASPSSPTNDPAPTVSRRCIVPSGRSTKMSTSPARMQNSSLAGSPCSMMYEPTGNHSTSRWSAANPSIDEPSANSLSESPKSAEPANRPLLVNHSTSTSTNNCLRMGNRACSRRGGRAICRTACSTASQDTTWSGWPVAPSGPKVTTTSGRNSSMAARATAASCVSGSRREPAVAEVEARDLVDAERSRRLTELLHAYGTERSPRGGSRIPDLAALALRQREHRGRRTCVRAACERSADAEHLVVRMGEQAEHAGRAVATNREPQYPLQVWIHVLLPADGLTPVGLPPEGATVTQSSSRRSIRSHLSGLLHLRDGVRARRRGDCGGCVRRAAPRVRSGRIVRRCCGAASTAASTPRIRCTSTTPAAGSTRSSQIDAHAELLRTRVLGNPHSNNPTSLATTALVRADPAGRARVLQRPARRVPVHLHRQRQRRAAARRRVVPVRAGRHVRPHVRQPQLGQRHPRVRPAQGRARSPTCPSSRPSCASTATAMYRRARRRRPVGAATCWPSPPSRTSPASSTRSTSSTRPTPPGGTCSSTPPPSRRRTASTSRASGPTSRRSRSTR